jgi:carboxymethylenebutenolidase
VTTVLTAADEHQLSAYEVHPAGATAAVVIVQEIFGVNSHIRSLVDRYAAMGYHAIAPALFDRVEPNVDLDYTPDGVARGREIRAGIEWDDSMLDVAAAVNVVGSTGPVAVIGFCYGGSIAWLAANGLGVSAAVGYYGGQVHLFRGRQPAVPVMLHFGADDQTIPLEAVAEISAMHPDVELHVYDQAGHGFNCDARSSYNPAAADLALGRTLRFIKDAGVR